MNDMLDLAMSYVMPIFGTAAIITMLAGGLFMMGAFWRLMFLVIRNRIRDGYWS